MARVVGAIVLVAALTLGPTVAPAPAGADPADTYLPNNTWSPQYNLGGCLYKVFWGNFGPSPFILGYFYNLSACGGVIVAVQYGSGQGANSSTVFTTATDGCGTYQGIIAYGPVGATALRGLVWAGTNARWYANDGLNTQPAHSYC